MFKKSILLKISLFFILLCFSNTIFAKKAAIIIDFDTQKTLFEVNADTLNFPASLTKIMTLYITFDYLEKNKISLETKMKVSKIAASRSPKQTIFRRRFLYYCRKCNYGVNSKISQ